MPVQMYGPYYLVLKDAKIASHLQFKDGLIVAAKPSGSVLFTGVSRAVIEADAVTATERNA